jgi:hypothetical protein
MLIHVNYSKKIGKGDTRKSSKYLLVFFAHIPMTLP